MKVSGVFSGTGSALFIGLGFIPDIVRVRNIHAADLAFIEWNRRMAAKATAANGIKYRDSTGVQMTALTATAGVEVYEGGDKIASASSAYIIAASKIEDVAGDMRAKGTLGLVNAFVLDTAGNRTGHFNAGVNTTYVGVGSVVQIAGKRYTITAITNDGEAADEVTLDRAAPSGAVERISYKLDFYNAPAGEIMPAGIVIRETADLNVSGELCLIEAETIE